MAFLVIPVRTQPLTRPMIRDLLCGLFQLGDASSLCCFQCHGAFTIRWQVSVRAYHPAVFNFLLFLNIYYIQGTRAPFLDAITHRDEVQRRCVSQAQRYYKHLQKAHGECACNEGVVRCPYLCIHAILCGA